VQGVPARICMWISRVLPLGIALATPMPQLRTASAVSANMASTGAVPPTPLTSQPADTKAVAPPSSLARDLQQAKELIQPTIIATVVAAALTYLLAPLTGPWAHSFKLIFAGAVAGIISRTFCAPLEMISTVIMCGRGGSDGLVTSLNKVWRQEGLRGLFKGNGANILKVAPSRGLQFLVYESIKRSMVDAGLSLTPGYRLIAAGLAGMSAATVVYPLDVAKTLLTLYPDRCSGVGQALGFAAKSGVGGLYRGLGPTLVAMFPYVGVEFMVYESLKVWWETLVGGTASTLALLALGAISGAASQTVAHPLDVVRRRLQMLGMKKQKDDDEPPFTNMIDGLYHIGSKEGPTALFRGLAPTCLEKVPSTAIGYFIYEFMKVTLRVSSV